MPIATEPQPSAPPKLRRMHLHESLGEGGGAVQVPSGRMVHPLQLRHVPLPCGESPLRTPVTHHARGAVKVRHEPGHRHDVGSGQGVGRDQARERIRLAKAAHFHEVLDRFGGSIGGKSKSCPAPYDRPHAEVQAGSKLPVDAHLLAAGSVAAGQGAVVQEAQGERLLDLVGASRPPRTPTRRVSRARLPAGVLHTLRARQAPAIVRGRRTALRRRYFEPWTSWASSSSIVVLQYSSHPDRARAAGLP